MCSALTIKTNRLPQYKAAIRGEDNLFCIGRNVANPTQKTRALHAAIITSINRGGTLNAVMKASAMELD